ncbi:MAG: TrkH family potassium uptake protein [Candidatus Thermoplasmatota archaeon]|nr:TrkH family potassium uptake protein [Candidatus Thermoplasmatota archaeon]
MRIKAVAAGVGTILMVIPALMLLPLVVGLLFKEDIPVLMFSFVLPGLFSFLLGLLMRGTGRSEMRDIRPSEALVVVSLAWLGVGAIGALPYGIMNVFSSPIDCFFESISGFTTTGSSVIQTIDVLPRSILFWRALTQWLGGMGIIVLAVALFSTMLGGPKAGFMLLKGEFPGHSKQKILPRVKDTAKALWLVYVALTLAQTAALAVLGVSIYDAICHSFTTLSTGGFSPYNSSVGHFSGMRFGILIEIVIIIFILFGNTNFVLHYNLFRGRWRGYLRDQEFRFYILAWSFFILLVMGDLIVNSIYSPLEALRHSAFYITSLMSTTGYATVDYDLWPPLSRFVLLIVMLMGGMTGSTAGAIKTARIFILGRIILRSIRRIGHPRAVMPLRIGNVILSEDIVRGVLLFFFGYISILGVSTLIMTMTGLDALSAFSSVAATLGNVGPGLGIVGPMQNYSSISEFGKLYLTFLMWLGRLELITCLVIFFPSTWRT